LHIRIGYAFEPPKDWPPDGGRHSLSMVMSVAAASKGVTNIPLWRHRDLILQLTAREVKQRYRGMYLGFLWSLLTPLLMMVVYTFVFSLVLKARWGDAGDQPVSPYDFALTLLAGLIPFTVFSEVVNGAPFQIVRVPNYVKKVVFPLEVLPVVSLGSAVVHSLAALVVLLAGTLILEGRIATTVLLLPLAYLPLILLCLASAWLLASIGVYVRDVGQTVTILTQVLLFMSPVFYPPSAVPEGLRFVLALNPLSFILDNFRRAILWNEGFDWAAWAIWVSLLLAAAVAGYMWFVKTKRGFADVM
jgi:lipopolysaccharide transport system permease protein